jgi:hypothetical protein
VQSRQKLFFTDAIPQSKYATETNQRYFLHLCAVRFLANNDLTTTCNYVDLGVVKDVSFGWRERAATSYAATSYQGPRTSR